MLKRLNGKLITLACLIVALVCSLSAAISLAFADEEHSHAFTDGKCACGAIRLEAEDADLTGSTPSPGNDTNLGTNSAASGGGLVCNWSVAGNKIVWRFSLNKNVTAPMELYLSPCEGATNFSSTLKLTVNGTEVGLVNDAMRGLVGEQWHNYSAFVTEDVTFAKGDVEIILEARRAYNVNIDCLQLDFAAANGIELGEYSVDPVHAHAFVDGRCGCGAALFEAETADLSGTTPSAGNDTNLGANANAFGGGLVCNWSVAGNSIVWRFSLDKQVTAPISLILSPCESATTFSSTLKLTVNGKEIGLADDNMRGIVNEGWHDYSAFPTNPVTFEAGNVEIVLQARRAYNVNIDAMIIGFAASDNVAVGEYAATPVHEHSFVNSKCECGAVRLEAEDADLTGSTPSPGNDTNLGTNSAASGGGLVNNWSVAGNKIVWRFSLNKGATAAMGLVLSPCEGATSFANTLSLTVNGVSVSLVDDAMRGLVGEQWHNYSTFLTEEVQFESGNVEIILQAKRAYNVNIDCLDVYFAAEDGVELGEYVPDEDPPVQEHTHAFTDGKCECGAVRLEAEEADLTGSTPSPGNDTNLGTNDAASGGGLVNNWSVAGNKIVWRFSLNKGATAAMGLVLSPCEGATSFANTLSLTVNGVSVSLVDDAMRGLVGEQWHNYSTFLTEEVQFESGNVEIILQAKRAYNVNIDCLDVYFAAEDGVELGEYVPDEDPPVQEHTHAFTDGKCECGAIRLEAEDADLTGSVSSDPESTVLGTNDAASGGGLVNNWAVAGNRIIWRFSLNKGATAAMGLVLSPCEGATSFANTLSLTVNGVEVALVDDAMRGLVGEQWHNYSTFLTEEVQFESGNVEIILQAKRAYNVNIDCLDIYFAAEDGVELGEYVPVIPEHTHEFTDGKCECGAVILEAESASIAGTPTGGTSFIEAYESASGGYIVANWREGDNIATFDFVLSAAAENVKIGICFAPTAASAGHYLPTTQEQLDNKQGLWGFELRVNSQKATYTSSYLPPFDGVNYYAFTTVWTNAVNLKSGANVIELEAWDYYSMNIDYIVIELPADVTLSQESVDRIAPTVSAITVETEDPKAGSAVTFTFEASDNLTAADQLNIDIKVYLGKVAAGNEVAVSGRSFTPAEAGKYYIVVTVTDEAGNETTKTRTVTVDAASTVTPPEENPGDNGDNGNEQENKGGSGCFGSLESGSAMFAGLIALGLLACVVLIVRLKKRGN